LIVGAYQADPNGKSNAGKSYVVFGKTDSTAINLSAIASGTGGFVINGENVDDISGNSVSTAGDVNGDGLNAIHILTVNNKASCATTTGNSREVNCCAVFFAEDDIGFSCV
jgi:hypothetical protein